MYKIELYCDGKKYRTRIYQTHRNFEKAKDYHRVVHPHYMHRFAQKYYQYINNNWQEIGNTFTSGEKYLIHICHNGEDMYERFDNGDDVMEFLFSEGYSYCGKTWEHPETKAVATISLTD